MTTQDTNLVDFYEIELIDDEATREECTEQAAYISSVW